MRAEESNNCISDLIIGIDATNLRQGGGITHLIELLRAAEPEKHGIGKVVVWGGNKLLAALENRAWLMKINPPELDQGLLRRALWQRRKLSSAAKEFACNLLFVPGGSYSGSFAPVVTMSRNLLPFESREFRRYGGSWLTLKNVLLRRVQSRTFRDSAGVIFLTDYARSCVLKVTGRISGRSLVIPHGLNRRFQIAPRPQRKIAEYSSTNPYRLIYVSIIDQYKHQWHVVEAVALLRREGFPLHLDLVGPAYPPALARLRKALKRLDPHGEWVVYRGAIPYAELHQKYAQADLGIFASSCENMPNILLETMAAGLPVACSNRGPMPEVLGNAGVYFDPEQPAKIAAEIRKLLESPGLRSEKAQAAFERAQQFSWVRCSDATFAFLAQVCARRVTMQFSIVRE